MGQGKNLTWIDQIRITNLAFVGFVYDSEHQSLPVTAPGNTPQTIAGLNNDLAFDQLC